ncbi:MAG: hypothetical protein QOH88_1045 [Verrucomicrobiota bacterium]|jgi:hypothetical protein
MAIPDFIGLTKASEEQLAQAFLLVANKHDTNAEVRETAKQLAEWSRRHIEALRPVAERLGTAAVDEPDRLRSALFHGSRLGGVGLLRDLQDLSLLAHQTRIQWVTLLQAAQGLHDQELVALCTASSEETERQRAWIETQIKSTAPQAINVTPDKSSTLLASVPKSPTPAVLPEIIWSPLGAGLLMAIVGGSAWLAGMPWLIPSLGPTAYLQVENPAHPSSRFYNTIVGHLVGLASGLIALALFQAWNSPSVLIDHQLVLCRVGAATLALLLTLLLTLLLKASHPPAGATTLLVALGAIRTKSDLINALVGIIIIAVCGEGLRQLRLKSATTRPDSSS